ncbi:MAG: hypothetical protein Q4G68_12330 [Planctomycetia bacterium]|nr:hypothetical protein [Planctomycetia bacterium]
MKKSGVHRLGATVSLALLLCFCPVRGGAEEKDGVEDKQVFQAGVASVDTSPTTLPIVMNGGFLPEYAEKVADPLHARALVLDDGTTRFAFCAVDICELPTDLVDEIKALVTEKIGLAPENICISATHCHSAPSLFSGHFDSVADEYRATFPQRVAEALIQANANLRPVRVGYGTCRERRFVFCRRFLMDPVAPWTIPEEFSGVPRDLAQMNPPREDPAIITRTGVPDQTVYVLAFQTLDGKPYAMLSNYSTHYAVMPPGIISADYFGVFANKVAELLDAPEEFVAMMTNGTSGDTNCFDFLKSAEEQPINATLVGEEIAKDVLEVYKNMTFADWVPLEVESRQLQLAIKQVTPEQLAAAEAWLEKLKADGKEPNRVADIYANATVKVSKLPQERSLLLQAVRVGDVGIGTIPCEVYSFTGHDLRAYSPFTPTFIIGLANGYNGYIPTLDQFQVGGYTTWRNVGTVLEWKAEPKIRAALRDMLEDIAAE